MKEQQHKEMPKTPQKKRSNEDVLMKDEEQQRKSDSKISKTPMKAGRKLLEEEKKVEQMGIEHDLKKSKQNVRERSKSLEHHEHGEKDIKEHKDHKIEKGHKEEK